MVGLPTGTKAEISVFLLGRLTLLRALVQMIQQKLYLLIIYFVTFFPKSINIFPSTCIVKGFSSR